MKKILDALDNEVKVDDVCATCVHKVVDECACNLLEMTLPRRAEVWGCIYHSKYGGAMLPVNNQDYVGGVR